VKRLILSFVLLSCMQPNVPPGTHTRCEDEPQRADLLFSAPNWDTEDIGKLRQAAQDWSEFSHGRINIRITRQDDPSLPHIHRMLSWMPKVRDKGDRRLGWFSGSQIYLIVDRIAPEQLTGLATHEMGHAAGLEWPLCDEDVHDCVHSPDPDAIMAPEFYGQPLGPSDLTFCRASCLCP
jgi:hypothetical protein